MRLHWASRPFLGLAAIAILFASANRAAAQQTVVPPPTTFFQGATPYVAPPTTPVQLPEPATIAPIAAAPAYAAPAYAAPAYAAPVPAAPFEGYGVVQAGPAPISATPDYGVVPVAAQIPHPIVVAAQPPLQPSAPSVLPPITDADVVGRLQQAEQRIKELEQAQAVDVRKHADSSTVIQSLKERWDQVQDPSITTVDQQTHGANTAKPSEKKWHDRLSIRGYAQLRFSQILETTDDSAPPQYVLDRSISDDQNFLLRRARLIVSGDVSDHMYVYLQTEFAQTPPGSPDQNHFAQIRDWYADWYLDDCKINRLRFGQSKVPYGWETLQSSSNRLPLERSDGINTGVRNERDLGIFYYWTPEPAQDFFKYVLDKGLKGSGNYGVFGMGVYNGQGGSFSEQNDDVHFVSRLTLPYQFSGGQCVEASIQGYIGEYAVLGSPISPLGIGGTATPAGTLQSATVIRDIRDERVAATFVYYPQPIGFQAEWNVGRGPALNETQTAVVDRHLYGGYVQTMAKIDTPRHGVIFPYLRWVLYNGGYKAERNAPFSSIDEWELGTEWQVSPQLEFTMAYLHTDRTNTTAFSTANVESYRQFDGSVLRFQCQFNY